MSIRGLSNCRDHTNAGYPDAARLRILLCAIQARWFLRGIPCRSLAPRLDFLDSRSPSVAQHPWSTSRTRTCNSNIPLFYTHLHQPTSNHQQGTPLSRHDTERGGLYSLGVSIIDTPLACVYRPLSLASGPKSANYWPLAHQNTHTTCCLFHVSERPRLLACARNTIA
jgi:hypothetical protein